MASDRGADHTIHGLYGKVELLIPEADFLPLPGGKPLPPPASSSHPTQVYQELFSRSPIGLSRVRRYPIGHKQDPRLELKRWSLVTTARPLNVGIRYLQTSM